MTTLYKGFTMSDLEAAAAQQAKSRRLGLLIHVFVYVIVTEVLVLCLVIPLRTEPPPPLQPIAIFFGLFAAVVGVINGSFDRNRGGRRTQFGFDLRDGWVVEKLEARMSPEQFDAAATSALALVGSCRIVQRADNSWSAYKGGYLYSLPWPRRFETPYELCIGINDVAGKQEVLIAARATTEPLSGRTSKKRDAKSAEFVGLLKTVFVDER